MHLIIRHGRLLSIAIGAALVAAVVGIAFFPRPSASPEVAIHQQTVAGPLTVDLTVAPASFGPNRVLIDLHDTRGRPVDGAQIRVAATMLDMAMGTVWLGAGPVGSGRYQVVAPLSMPGHWRADISIRAPSLSLRGVQARFAFALDSGQRPVPTALPLLAGAALPTETPIAVAPSAVRWTGLPYAAAVSFLASGSVLLPGDAALLRDGTLNHAIARVPGRDELWATDYSGGQVAAIDLRARTVAATIPVGLGPVHIAFSANGARAWVSDFISNDVSVIDTRTRLVLATVDVGLHPHGIALSPDGREVWVACGGAGALWVLDARTDAVLAQVPAGLQPHAVAFSPDGRRVYMTDAGAEDLVIVDRAARNVIARVHIGTGSAMDSVSRDGARVYVTGQSGDVVTVVDARAQRVAARIGVGSAPHGLVLTPDGRLLYVAVNNADHVSVIDTASGRVVATVPVPGQADELALVR